MELALGWWTLQERNLCLCLQKCTFCLWSLGSLGAGIYTGAAESVMMIRQQICAGNTSQNKTIGASGCLTRGKREDLQCAGGQILWGFLSFLPARGRTRTLSLQGSKVIPEFLPWPGTRTQGQCCHIPSHTRANWCHWSNNLINSQPGKCTLDNTGLMIPVQPVQQRPGCLAL